MPMYSDNCGKSLKCWGEQMKDLELTQEKKEQLIRRITDLLEQNVLKVPDWCAMYDIMLEACEREKALSMENYLIDCLDGDNSD